MAIRLFDATINFADHLLESTMTAASNFVDDLRGRPHNPYGSVMSGGAMYRHQLYQQYAPTPRPYYGPLQQSWNTATGGHYPNYQQPTGRAYLPLNTPSFDSPYMPPIIDASSTHPEYGSYYGTPFQQDSPSYQQRPYAPHPYAPNIVEYQDNSPYQVYDHDHANAHWLTPEQHWQNQHRFIQAQPPLPPAPPTPVTAPRFSATVVTALKQMPAAERALYTQLDGLMANAGRFEPRYPNLQQNVIVNLAQEAIALTEKAPCRTSMEYTYAVNKIIVQHAADFSNPAIKKLLTAKPPAYKEDSYRMADLVNGNIRTMLDRLPTLSPRQLGIICDIFKTNLKNAPVPEAQLALLLALEIIHDEANMSAAVRSSIFGVISDVNAELAKPDAQLDANLTHKLFSDMDAFLDRHGVDTLPALPETLRLHCIQRSLTLISHSEMTDQEKSFKAEGYAYMLINRDDEQPANALLRQTVASKAMAFSTVKDKYADYLDPLLFANTAV